MKHSVATITDWLKRIHGSEGAKFSMDPDDPGNWTGGRPSIGVLIGSKFGISANTYPDLDIENLTWDDAADIYIRDFLAPLKADRYPDGVAYAMLDFAIHSGGPQAKLELQRAVGVRADGIIGPVTLAAINSFSEAQLVMLITGRRLHFMTNRANWSKHGRGWARRIARNLEYGAHDCAE